MCCHVPSSCSDIFVKCCSDCCPGGTISHQLQRALRGLAQLWPRSFLSGCSVCLDDKFCELCLIKSIFFYFIFMELFLLLLQWTCRNCFLPFPRSMPPYRSVCAVCKQLLALCVRISALTCTLGAWLTWWLCVGHRAGEDTLISVSKPTVMRWLCHLCRLLECNCKGPEHLMYQNISAFHL